VKRVWVVIIAIILALLWQQVFAMTGLLWWNASAETVTYARPAAPEIKPAPAGWVDVGAYLRTHSVWMPTG